MLGKVNHEPHEPWLAPPARHQPSTRPRSVPDTRGCVTELRKGDQVTASMTKGAPRGAHSSHHAKGNRIMCSATGETCLLTYTALIHIGRLQQMDGQSCPLWQSQRHLPETKSKAPWRLTAQGLGKAGLVGLSLLLLCHHSVKDKSKSCLTYAVTHMRNTPNRVCQAEIVVLQLASKAMASPARGNVEGYEGGQFVVPGHIGQQLSSSSLSEVLYYPLYFTKSKVRCHFRVSLSTTVF